MARTDWTITPSGTPPTETQIGSPLTGLSGTGHLRLTRAGADGGLRAVRTGISVSNAQSELFVAIVPFVTTPFEAVCQVNVRTQSLVPLTEYKGFLFYHSGTGTVFVKARKFVAGADADLLTVDTGQLPGGGTWGVRIKIDGTTLELFTRKVGTDPGFVSRGTVIDGAIVGPGTIGWDAGVSAARPDTDVDNWTGYDAVGVALATETFDFWLTGDPARGRRRRR